MFTRRDFIYPLLSFIVPFVVYVITIAPSVYFIDSGELGAAASNLNIAHPTGYPLFTLIGNLFSKLPFGSKIFNLNLMSAVFGALGSLMLYKLLSLFSFNSNRHWIRDNLKNSQMRLLRSYALVVL